MSASRARSMLAARLSAGLAFVLSLSLALFVLLYWRDGHWMLLAPAAATLLLIVSPNRLTAALAITATAVLVVLGALSVGYYYIPSLILLLVALASLPRPDREATA